MTTTTPLSVHAFEMKGRKEVGSRKIDCMQRAPWVRDDYKFKIDLSRNRQLDGRHK